jgi:hypothetical protein
MSERLRTSSIAVTLHYLSAKMQPRSQCGKEAMLHPVPQGEDRVFHCCDKNNDLTGKRREGTNKNCMKNL